MIFYPRRNLLIILTSLLVTLVLSSGAWSAPDTIIPPDRRVNWNPGVTGGIPNRAIVNSVTDFGAVANNASKDNRVAFQSAIDAAAAAGGGTVFVPAGTYYIKSPNQYYSGIELRSGVTLRGASPYTTHIVFDFSGVSKEVNAVKILGWQTGSFVSVTGGYTKGSRTLTLANASSFKAGNFAELQQKNDSRISNESWALNAVGEIVKVVAVSGNRITLAEPLHYTYQASLQPVIRTVNMIHDAGIEKLHLRRADRGPGQMILLYNAANVWVREIISEDILNSHVLGYAAYKCEISESYFHHAYSYGTGGQGYGVGFEMHTTDCLVENNIFRSLRHAMIVQVGASGNVFAYNYSREPVQTQGGNWTPPDISVHGHYASYNLFEGNIVQEIDDSDYWGASGPGNTFLRNCTQAEGIELMNASHKQNIVGNVLGYSLNVISDDGTVRDTLIHGNYQLGSVQWDPSIPDRNIPKSYYLGSRPSFYRSQNLPWPSTGPDVIRNAATCINPARQRWDSGRYIYLSSSEASTNCTPAANRTSRFVETWGYVMPAGTAAKGSKVTAHRPDGTQIGCFTVHTPNDYGLMRIYGEDPSKPSAPGARDGEKITFRVNGVTMQDSQSLWDVRWQASRDNQRAYQVDLYAQTPATMTPTPVPTTNATSRQHRALHRHPPSLPHPPSHQPPLFLPRRPSPPLPSI
ncbi:MAG: hypothetical protein GXP38_08150 [Chloroflexi bacterium]|nr:hypothetical protein [Chloroflexota bacterium]